jgi:hypothetical protein
MLYGRSIWESFLFHARERDLGSSQTNRGCNLYRQDKENFTFLSRICRKINNVFAIQTFYRLPSCGIMLHLPANLQLGDDPQFFQTGRPVGTTRQTKSLIPVGMKMKKTK